MANTRSQVICPCGEKGFRYLFKKRSTWTVKGVNRLRHHASKLDIEQYLRKSKESFLYSEKKDGETVYKRRGKMLRYYRYGHYDPSLYRTQLERYRAGKLKHKPNGIRWCKLVPNYELKRTDWHQMYQSVLPINQFHVSIQEYVYEVFKIQSSLWQQLFDPDKRVNFDDRLVSLGKYIFDWHEILQHYAIPPEKIMFLRHIKMEIVLEFQEKILEFTKLQKPDIEQFRRLRSDLFSLLEQTLTMHRTMHNHVLDYYTRHFRYPKDFGDEKPMEEIICEVVDHMSSKRRNQILKLRTRDVPEAFEPKNAEDSTIFNFSGMQCTECQGWRVDEIDGTVGERSYKCHKCGNIMMKTVSVPLTFS